MSAFGEWDLPAEEPPAPSEGEVAPPEDDAWGPVPLEEPVLDERRTTSAPAGPEDDPAVLDDVDRLADAQGALVVAEAKRDEVIDSDKKTHADRVAAEEAVAKAERARDRAAAKLARTRASAAADAAALLADPDDAAGAPSTYYGSVDEWMRRWMLPTYRRITKGGQGGVLWRADWWRSAEAISRLDALWRAWEHLRLDPDTGMSVWWSMHADHHMGVLLSQDGPFKGLREAEGRTNRAGEQLPYEPPPEGLFPPDHH